MQFLVIEKVVGNIPDKALEESGTGVAYFENLKQGGKLKGHFHFAGIAGGAYILEVSSNDELGEIIIGSPFYRFTTREIFPLMGHEAMVSAEKAAVRKA